MVRIPDAPRFEFRLADAATNPYLLPAALTVAGADGMVKKLDPGARSDVNMYDTASPAAAVARAGAGKLPLNLLDALRELESTDSGSTLLNGIDPSGRPQHKVALNQEEVARRGQEEAGGAWMSQGDPEGPRGKTVRASGGSSAPPHPPRRSALAWERHGLGGLEPP